MYLSTLTGMAFLAVVILSNLVTFAAAVFFERKRVMNSDDFVAKAIEQARLANLTTRRLEGEGPVGQDGIFVVGHHITIVTNVHNSDVAGRRMTSDQAAEATPS